VNEADRAAEKGKHEAEGTDGKFEKAGEPEEWVFKPVEMSERIAVSHEDVIGEEGTAKGCENGKCERAAPTGAKGKDDRGPDGYAHERYDAFEPARGDCQECRGSAMRGLTAGISGERSESAACSG
jgi:hypothetical protein